MEPVKLGTRTTVDVETGEVRETKQQAMTLLPPAPGRCPECATEHEPEQPHNQQSLYYLMAFQAKHGRSPTWTDAMAHCDEPTRSEWRQELRRLLAEKNLPIWFSPGTASSPR